MKVLSFPIITFLFLLGFSSFVAAQRSAEIFLNVTIERENNGFVNDLKAENFRVRIGKTVQQITSFQLNDEPISVGVLIDVSGSIGRANQLKNPGLKPFIEGVKQLVNLGNDTNEYFVTGFNTQIFSVVDKTKSRDVVLHGLEELQNAKTSGNTSFYDALRFGLEKISGAKHRKRVLLVMSDGTDNSSKSTFNDISLALKSSDVLLYSVSFNPGGFSSIDSQQGFAFLDHLTALSGGKSLYVKKTDQIRSVFEKISTELRSQYMLGFMPTKEKSGKWNKIKVEVDLSENISKQTGKIAVRYREGFVY